MEAFAEFGVFHSFQYRSPIYEFEILQSDKLAGINSNNDFRANLAGLAVSSKNNRELQKT